MRLKIMFCWQEERQRTKTTEKEAAAEEEPCLMEADKLMMAESISAIEEDIKAGVAEAGGEVRRCRRR